jgi:hypothetical protein
MFFTKVPVDNIPKGSNIIRALILVLQVISMLPHIKA